MTWDTDWAYLAGLIDGEGCISASSQHAPRYHAQLKVLNTDRRMLNWIRETFAKGSVSVNRLGEGNSKTCFKWRVTGKENVAYILTEVLPYLVIKKDQALLARELCERPEQSRQREIYEKLKELHR